MLCILKELFPFWGHSHISYAKITFFEIPSTCCTAYIFSIAPCSLPYKIVMQNHKNQVPLLVCIICEWPLSGASNILHNIFSVGYQLCGSTFLLICKFF